MQESNLSVAYPSEQETPAGVYPCECSGAGVTHV